MSLLFDQKSLDAAMDEIRKAALQMQQTTAAAEELIRNTNEIVARLNVIVMKLSAALK